MSWHNTFIALWTLTAKEVRRFLRIWPQTLFPQSITMVMYFLIFGHLIGSRIGNMEGFSYINYIVPGLIMMSVITNSFTNVASSFFGYKFQRAIEELLVSPMPGYVILLGFVIGGIARGLLVGLIVTGISLFFTSLPLLHPLLTLVVVFLTASLFSIGGFINALYANKFDDISIIPIFVLTPLTYLGGVFYSIHLLPPFWQSLSFFNPILYMVNTFRYGIIGISDIDIRASLLTIVILNVVLFCAALYLLNRGRGVRN